MPWSQGLLLFYPHVAPRQVSKVGVQRLPRLSLLLGLLSDVVPRLQLLLLPPPLLAWHPLQRANAHPKLSLPSVLVQALQSQHPNHQDSCRQQEHQQPGGQCAA